MFCHECGAKNKASAKFCAKCGEALKKVKKAEEDYTPSPQQIATAVQQQQQSEGMGAGTAFIITIGVIFLIFALVLLVTGWPYEPADDYYYPGGGGSSGGTSGGTGSGCPAGTCNSNGNCCPSNYRYYCEGSCYASQSDALSVGGARCSTYRIIC